MRYQELSKSLNNLSNVYLISGEDRFLCYSALDQITKASGIVNTQLNLTNLDGSNIDEIINSANSYPFMDNYRMVVVKDFVGKNLSSKQKDKLIDFIKNPLKTTILVFLCFNEDSFFKPYKDILTFVDCSKLDAKSISDYITQKFNAAKVDYQPAAIGLIGEYCLYSMQRVSQEVEKLIAYSGGQKQITTEVVNGLVIKDKEYQIYELADFLANGKGLMAYDLVDTLARKNGLSVLTPLYNNYRRVLYISINSNASDAELASMLGIKEFAVKMAKRQVRAFTPKKLKQIVDMLKDMDAGIKKGKIKEDVALKLAISNILNLRNK